LFISHDLHVVHYLSDHVMVMYLGEVVESGPVEDIYGNTAHPYTRALLSAVPSMDPDHRTQASPLVGDPPNPINPSGGCRFRERCTHAQAVCESQHPVLMPVAGKTEHLVACHMNNAMSTHTEANPEISV
jgi:peptide/nickel transport system ATP-binding protein